MLLFILHINIFNSSNLLFKKYNLIIKKRNSKNKKL